MDLFLQYQWWIILDFFTRDTEWHHKCRGIIKIINSCIKWYADGFQRVLLEAKTIIVPFVFNGSNEWVVKDVFGVCQQVVPEVCICASIFARMQHLKICVRAHSHFKTKLFVVASIFSYILVVCQF